MDIAKSIMKKYGWKEGDGLGKDSDGITKPIRVNYKFDTQGLGVDNSEEFTNHWWERQFDEASKNVNVKKNGDEVSFSVHDSVEITTKTYPFKRQQKLKRKSKYKNFSKASVLKKNIETFKQNHVDLDDLKPEIKVLSDDDLIAACGGRTAHKGARHGLNLSGKLARIEEQDQKMLTLLNKSNSEANTNLEIVEVEENIKRELVDVPGDEEEADHLRDKKEADHPWDEEEAADHDKIEKLLNSMDYVYTSKKWKEDNKIYNVLSQRIRALDFDKYVKKKEKEKKKMKEKQKRKKKKKKKNKKSKPDPIHQIQDICIAKTSQSTRIMKRNLLMINDSLSQMKF